MNSTVPTLDMVNLAIFAINIIAVRAIFPEFKWHKRSMFFHHMGINWFLWFVIYKTAIPAPMCLATNTSHVITRFTFCINIILYTHCLAIWIWALSISLRLFFVHLFWFRICFAWFVLDASHTKMILDITFNTIVLKTDSAKLLSLNILS